MSNWATLWSKCTPDNKRSLILAALFFAFAAAGLSILLFPSLAPYTRVLAALMLPVLAITFVQANRNARNQEVLDKRAVRLQGQVDAKRQETSATLEALAHASKRSDRP